MWRYIVRRLLQAVPVLLGISLITFALVYYLPADPARMYAGPSATAETVARIRHQLGLDLPLWQQYVNYIGNILQGDLGFSYRKQEPVLTLMPEPPALLVGAHRGRSLRRPGHRPARGDRLRRSGDVGPTAWA